MRESESQVDSFEGENLNHYDQDYSEVEDLISSF